MNADLRENIKLLYNTKIENLYRFERDKCLFFCQRYMIQNVLLGMKKEKGGLKSLDKFKGRHT